MTPSPGRAASFRRLGAVLAVVVAAAMALAWVVLIPVQQVRSTSLDRCVAEAGAEQQDVDTDDSPEYPWGHVPGEEVTVYFETGGLPARYANFVEEGAAIWSQSPCVEAIAVEQCPAQGNCSAVTVKERSGDRGTDGESESDDRDGVRVANTLTFYTRLLDQSSDNGALATVVHEMGHALGLVHRKNPDSVMNAETDDDTNPIPDETDFANLVAIYGQSASPGQAR